MRLWERVKRLEEQSELDGAEIGGAKRYLLSRFGRGGCLRANVITGNEETILDMVLLIVGWYEAMLDN